MKEIEFSIEINAAKEKVWSVLWEDVTFRDWAGIIDEGTYMKGVLEEGNEIQFISSVNGYGVTDFIEKLIPNEYVLFRHSSDTQEGGKQKREKEWTGGSESYFLSEDKGVTTLVVKSDIPKEQEEIFGKRFPEALTWLKTLAEIGSGYSRQELDEALKTISSIVSKCENIHPKFAEGTSQHTLLKNRINALNISKSLISGEVHSQKYKKEDLAEALKPVDSIMSKCKKAQQKFDMGDIHYNRHNKIIKAMQISKSFLEYKIKGGV